LKKEVLQVFKTSRSILAEYVPTVLTPEEYTENLMNKLDKKTEGKVSKEVSKTPSQMILNFQNTSRNYVVFFSKFTK
jgi:hypothetical protein